MAQNNLDKIEHIVVLMMENRSFDNVLGWLYDLENKPPFNKTPNKEYYGVNKTMCNPDETLFTLSAALILLPHFLIRMNAMSLFTVRCSTYRCKTR